MTRLRSAAAALAVAACFTGCVTGCGAGTRVAAPSRSSAAPALAPSPTAAPAAPAGERVPVPGGAAAAVPVVDAAARPVRLAVPTIGVDTDLVQLGIEPDGALQVPTSYGQAGWLDRSPAPGQRGPAVIAGHIDSTSGPAVFYRLRELAPGAQITVTRADGAQVSFSVDGVQQYPKNAFPTAAVYGPVPGPVLRLITCGGSFDRSTGHYRDNVVVYATEIGA